MDWDIYAAHAKPILFKAIYVGDILSLKMADIVPQESLLDVIRRDTCSAEKAGDQLLELATQAWIFAHGLASLIANDMIVYGGGKVERLLESFIEQRDVL